MHRFACLCAPLVFAALAFELPAQLLWVERAPIPEAGPWTFDPVRGRAVSFNNKETFEWDGSVFVRLSPAFSPNTLAGHAMAWSPAIGKAVAVGASTYVWDGEFWAGAGRAPRSSYGMALAYDAPGGRMLMFGGASGATEFGDTWAFHGTSWSRVATTGPSPRLDHSMVWDTDRNVIVLFGGRASGGINFDDTWEWNGTAWSQVATTGPTADKNVPMVYDEARNRTLVLTDSAGTTATWEWDGSTWTQVDNSGPPLVYAARDAMVYDPATQRVVLLAEYGVVWDWDGAVWTETLRRQPPDVSPSHRRLAYDSNRQRAIAVHGGETWEWKGSSWEDRSGSPHPQGYRHNLAYDPLRSKTVLFGGYTNPSFGPPLGATWEWDGQAWVQHFPANNPPPRTTAAMAWDPIGQRILMAGGSDGSGTQFTDTWAWDGTGWLQLNPSTALTASPSNAATDLARNRIVVTAVTPAFSGETWEWDGADWTRVTQTSGNGELAYDPTLGGVVASGSTPQLWNGASWQNLPVTFGVNPYAGRSSFGHAVTFDEAAQSLLILGDSWGETWTLGQNHAAAATANGAGCPTQGAPRLIGWGTPAIGASGFKLDLLGGPESGAGAVLFAAAAGSVPVAGCTLRIDPATFLISVPISTSGAGHAVVTMPIPLWPSLDGITLQTQAAALHPGAPNGLVLSNSVGLRFGY